MLIGQLVTFMLLGAVFMIYMEQNLPYLYPMYSRSEIVQLKQAFWTAFGRYLSLETNSEGESINWVNYHTGFKDLYFRMDADQSKAYIGIELKHTDDMIRRLYVEKFQQFRRLLVDAVGEEWTWDQDILDVNGKPMSKIFTELPNVNVFNQDHWPTIISFLKPRIIGLDKFWNEVKDGFEELR